MRWQTKAKIMKICALLPAGGIYRFIQKTFGRLKADPMSRINVVNLSQRLVAAEKFSGLDPMFPWLFSAGPDRLGGSLK